MCFKTFAKGLQIRFYAERCRKGVPQVRGVQREGTTTPSRSMYFPCGGKKGGAGPKISGGEVRGDQRMGDSGASFPYGSMSHTHGFELYPGLDGKPVQFLQ